MSSKLVPAVYQDHTITFNDEAWINATEAAAKYGKNPSEWLRLPSTVEYLGAIERKYGKIPYLKTKRGSGGGTWISPKLAVNFARWLDVDFAVWCGKIDVSRIG